MAVESAIRLAQVIGLAIKGVQDSDPDLEARDVAAALTTIVALLVCQQTDVEDSCEQIVEAIRGRVRAAQNVAHPP